MTIFLLFCLFLATNTVWSGSSGVNHRGGATDSVTNKAPALRVAFLALLPYETASRETRAAYEFLKSNVTFNPDYLTFDDIRKKPRTLDSFRAVWIHRPDTTVFSPAEKDPKILSVLQKYLDHGGNLLLTLDAFRYLNLLKIETESPSDSMKPVVDEGYGRKLGLHSFLDHPVFDGMYGGAYLMMPVRDTAFRITGFFGDRVPENGKVIGVDWDYIFLRESTKLMIEYRLGKGSVIAVGGYTCFSVPNYNRNHLERFTVNIFNYLSGNASGTPVHTWDYSPFHVAPSPGTASVINNSRREIPESREWIHPRDPLLLSAGYASSGFWDLAGERILTMGTEPGGIEEIWVHPIMAFRDYEVGLRFSFRDTIYWLSDERPSIEVFPFCFVRTYKFARAYLEEIIANDPTEPAAVVHYEYKGVYPAELVVRIRSNLRLMWPYSGNVTGPLLWEMDSGSNAWIVKQEKGSFCAMVGANRSPADRIAGQYSGFTYPKGSGQIEGDATAGRIVSASFRFPLQMNDRMDLVFTASSEGEDRMRRCYDEFIQDPVRILQNARRHTDTLLSQNLMITSPDLNFNNGYRWAMLAADRFFVTTPGMGSSLVAGYSTTRRGWNGGHSVNGRPGYGWYFGRDGEWSGFAMLDYGDFKKVKSLLEFYMKFQDLSGKIFHEATTSGVIHYDASDATPLFIVLAGKYFRHTRDSVFLREHWTSIRRAIDFCFSTDTDRDHLIENTNVGHGWVEGGELFGSHATIYNQGCWAASLDETANMASFLNLPDAESYSVESPIVKSLINTGFWNSTKKYFSYGMNKDRTFRSEPTLLPAVPASFKLMDVDKVRPMLEQIASNAFTTNWGTRILRDDSPYFNPTGYHYGSVWPLFTGWASLAEYNYGFFPQGFSHIMNNLNLYRSFGKGFAEEVLNGATYEPSGVCPHQCWSETMILQPVIEGMLGIKIRGQENTLELAPHFPANWDSVKVTNIKMGGFSLDFEMKRTPDRYFYTFTPHGNTPVQLEFLPTFPAGTEFGKILKNDTEVPFSTFSDPGNASLMVKMTLEKSCSLEVEYRRGIGVIPVVPDPRPGSGSSGLRVISARLVGDQYYLVAEGERRTTGTVGIYLHGVAPRTITNGKILSLNGETMVISVDFEPGDTRYLKKTIGISLLPEPASGAGTNGK